MAWEYQREWKEKPIPTRNELISMISDIDDPTARALCSMAYLTAGRISEIVKKKYLIKTYYQKDTKTKRVGAGYLITKRTLKDISGKYIVDKVELNEINYSGIRKKDLSTGFEFVDGKKIKVLYINMANRKNKKVKFKRLPIPVEEEKLLIDYIFLYGNNYRTGDLLFPFSQWHAGQLIRKHLGMNPHYLRDIRLSHLVMYYGFNEQQLQKFAGWTDSRPAAIYVKLRTSDIVPVRKR